MTMIFLSYAREDMEMAKRLHKDLTDRGLKVWMDKKDLLPGQNWKIFISKAIKESSHFLALFSSHSVSKRGFFQKELKKAMDVLEELPEYEVYFIPARLDECDPASEKLSEIHWADLFPDYTEGLSQILRVFDLEESYPEEQAPQHGHLVPPPPIQQPAAAGARITKQKSVKHPCRNHPLDVSEDEFQTGIPVE